jgi:hypothetical protein
VFRRTLEDFCRADAGIEGDAFEEGEVSSPKQAVVQRIAALRE